MNSTPIAAVLPKRLQISNIFWIMALHVVAIGVAPFYFNWNAFAWCLAILFLVTPLGVNLGYHRLLSHRGLVVPKWLEYTLAAIGTMLGGGPVLLWVAEHRLHHRYSDQDQDPHDSRNGFWHSHMTHLFWHKDFEDIEEQWVKYVPDLAKQPFYRFLNKYSVPLAVAVVPVLYYLGGLPYVMWIGFVRVTLMLHCTWFVNSATHRWGYRNYDSRDRSSNVWWVALVAAGEGWHNNHHAEQRSAAHGHRWWEIDQTWAYIRGLEILGLATRVVRPKAWVK